MCEAQGAKEHINSMSRVGRVWSIEDSEGEASKGRQGPDDKRSAWPARGEVSMPGCGRPSSRCLAPESCLSLSKPARKHLSLHLMGSEARLHVVKEV